MLAGGRAGVEGALALVGEHGREAVERVPCLAGVAAARLGAQHVDAALQDAPGVGHPVLLGLARLSQPTERRDVEVLDAVEVLVGEQLLDARGHALVEPIVAH